MEPVGEYTQQIDKLLSAGCALFPNEQPTDATPAPTPIPAFAPGAGGLADSAQQASARYRDIDHRIAELTASLDEAVKFAAAQAIRAGLDARAIRDGADAQADAMSGATKTPDGVGELVATMDERLAAMAQHISTTREQLRASAATIRQLSVDLSAAAAARP